MRTIVRLLLPASTALTVVLLVAAFSGMREQPEPLQRPSNPGVTQPRLDDTDTGWSSSSSATPTLYTWRTFTTRDGLPSNKIYCVRVDGERVWIGTDAGLVRYEKDRFHTYTVADGLAHQVVLSIEVDATTGDVWIGTMGGLNRWSAGRFETFNQLNSGLANDVVYAVAMEGHNMWAATASGASRLNTRTRQWSIFNETNAPMHEPWTYGVSANDGMVYIAAWGGGVLELNSETEQWKDYRDPDEEMELDVFPNDGLVHDVTSSVSYENGILWAATYFGLSRFDGTRWKGYFDHDSGLASNFINFVKANGPVVWICTDKGLNRFDGTAWHTYRRTPAGRGEILVSNETGDVTTLTRPTALSHNYILGIDFQEEAIWVATENGLSRGVPEGMSKS